ncbi:response regulator transcription factor [Nigerium massiliense]|uniref:response regulator transcription factor n=1 Tax=Nigerium massiliense TaxID=1522317 RepID=UPI001F3E5164|nr:response regulator transcription factor [Nigerium massiliense]
MALVNDYDLVVAGLDHFFDSYPNDISVVQLAADSPVDQVVDIALYDTFGHGSPRCDAIRSLLSNPRVSKTVVYSWMLERGLIEECLASGVSGYLSKSLTAREMVAALQRIHGGETVISPTPAEKELPVGGEWPGRSEALTGREAEIIAMIAQGYSNQEIADRARLSINSVKSYIRNAYRKIDVSRRSQAVGWALEHGFSRN